MDRENKTEEQLGLALENPNPGGAAMGKPLSPAAMAEEQIKGTPRHAFLGAAVVAMVCLTVLLYGVFFWPRLYDVASVKTGDKIYPVRINRITGNVNYFDGEAWRNAPVPAAGAPERSQTLSENAALPDRQQPQNVTAGAAQKGPFAVQIKAVDNWIDANSMMAELKKIGADVHFAAVPMGERGIWYRILIGHFKDADAAAAYMRENRLKDYFPDSFIQKLSQ
jgi:hypothetical protein